MPDHPRSRGENKWQTADRVALGGSPPLARGKHQLPVRDRVQRGITPARAGKTTKTPPTLRGHGDHPRSRGENRRRACGHVEAHGSPPLARGKHHAGGPQLASLGITPARAGKTRQPSRAGRQCSDHPRSRGENAPFSAPTMPPSGSPPLARGKRRATSGQERIQRITPARAGKTSLFPALAS